MDSFRFKCITVSKTETSKGFFVKAVNKNGPVELFIYGKKTPIDSMIYMEVAGLYKNTNKNYLTVKSMNIINRFQKIRESFLKLSVAMTMIEIAYSTKIGMGLLLNGLTMLEKYSHKTAFIWFGASFLIKNGVFNKNSFSEKEISLISFILKAENKERLMISDAEFKPLAAKFIKLIEEYSGISFSFE